MNVIIVKIVLQIIIVKKIDVVKYALKLIIVINVQDVYNVRIVLNVKY